MWYVHDVLYAVLYVRVSCFVVRGCAVSRRYIDVCYCDVFSVINVYLDHLKFCVVCINGRRYVWCGECYVVSGECEVMYFGCFDFRGELGFLNCDDICMCAVNKQFELFEFVFESVYVDLQYDYISLTFTAGSVCLCGVSSPVVVIVLSVRCRGTLCCRYGCCGDCSACVYAVRMLGCEGDGNADVGSGGGVVAMSVYMGYTWFRCFG